MQLLDSTLCVLLVSCLCWGSGEFLSVIQAPAEIHLKNTDTVEISCNWTSVQTGVKVKWIKDNATIEMIETDKFSFRSSSSSISATLIINNADVNDAGLYFCEVTQDIPYLLTVKGPGTRITPNNGTTPAKSTPGKSTPGPSASATTPGRNQQSTALVPSLSGVALFLFICVGVTVLRIKRRCRPSERSVIKEMPPSEGVEPGNSEDGGSTQTSRGSTQWHTVPVYESYFDLHRGDEQQCADPDATAGTSFLKS